MAAPVPVDVPFGNAVPGQPPSLGCGLPLPEAGTAPVHELVAELAGLHPDRWAVRSGGQALTYAELDAWAARIAARLHAAGVGRGERVGLVAEPSAAAVASALGILRAGAAYVPV
ncbi:MAG TPA: AMP-binding protein, partial [Micromonosporaceae bacterium]|nr:AMP-binding protein [Micromonosporaceae bacterium]